MNNIMDSKSFPIILVFSFFILFFSIPYSNAQDADKIAEGIEKGAKITKGVIKALGEIFGDDDKEEKKKSGTGGEEEGDFESQGLNTEPPGQHNPYPMGQTSSGGEYNQTPHYQPYGQNQTGFTSGGYNQSGPYQPGYRAAPGGQYTVPNQTVGPGQYPSTGGGYYPNQVNQGNTQYGPGQGGYTGGGYNQTAPYQQSYGTAPGGQYTAPNQPYGQNQSGFTGGYNQTAPYQPGSGVNSGGQYTAPNQPGGITNPNQTHQSNTGTGTTSSSQSAYVPIKPVSVQKQAEALRNEGYVLYQNTQYQMAIDVLNRAIQLNPMDSYAYFYRGVSYMGLKLIDMAIRDLQMSIDLNPGYSHSYSNLGAAFLEVKDLDNAIRTCSTAIQLNPNHTLGYYNRGVAYMLSKQYQLAFADFSQVLRLNPNHQDAKVNIEYVQKKLAKGNPTD
ncbi:MAG TPA: tetratricopeptide repeat protein [Thermodesulfobacteriota bacterium]|nr:tetratricopeptide repeat protein [Thermodesulfobacteriota bacterium]